MRGRAINRRWAGDGPNAPKRALLYQSAERMESSSWTTAGDGVDLLADKRQVVAFGIHPRAGRPYMWPHESPLDVHRDHLSAVTGAQVLEFREATSAAPAAAVIKPGQAQHDFCFGRPGHA